MASKNELLMQGISTRVVYIHVHYYSFAYDVLRKFVKCSVDRIQSS